VLGNLRPDLVSFLPSHTTMREALRAHTVVLAAGRTAPRGVPFAEIAPIAFLARELDVAQSWVVNVLGPLANDDDQAAGL
jgi:hypothetical protein